MNSKMKGIVCGVISAMTYGMNPLGALNLYSDGINVDTVLVYRYGLAMLVLGGIMLLRKESFAIEKKGLSACLLLGLCFAVASLALFTSFHYMDAGMACTILFVYPVIVAIIMAVFFRERISLVTALSIALALVGIGLLYDGGDGTALSTTGVLLALLSALAYAVYMVGVNRGDLRLSPVKLSFYVMLFGAAAVFVHSLFGAENHIQPLTTLPQWLWALMLAIVPTVISLVLMVVAVKNIGSTPTAILGALEPVTAVIIGVMVFNEKFTPRIAIGLLLILAAVSLVVAQKPAAAKKTS